MAHPLTDASLCAALSLLLFSVPAQAAPGAASQGVELLVPSGTPERVRLAVSVHGRRAELLLAHHELRAADAKLRVYGADGETREEPLPAPRTYRGSVLGAPDVAVLASLGVDGWRIDVVGDPQGDWALRPAAHPGVSRLSSASGASVRHTLLERDALTTEPFVCGSEPAPATAVAASPSGGSRLGTFGELDPLPLGCQNRAEIAFDADYEYYLLQGGTVAGTIARIDAHMNLVDYFYARDARITYVITGYVVRTAPFYMPLNGNDLLDLFQAEWVANQAPVLSYDLAHLMTDKTNINYGGLAKVGVVCDKSSSYAWSLDSAGIIGHEVGHNWNAPHCLDPTPCNAMCGACLVLGPNTKDVIVAFRDSRACLEVVGPYPTNLPPFAYPDRIEILKDQLPGIGSVTFDVLANDEDGNCEPIGLDSFQAVSDLGGSVARVSGAGPAGRDVLDYTPPPGLFVGEDRFTYDVVDARGAATTGGVVFEVEPLALEGYWKLDEALASEPAEDSAGSYPGLYLGSPTLLQPPAPSLPGTSVRFDGSNDLVRLPDLDLNSNRVTLAAWVRRDGDQVPFAGLVLCNRGKTFAGLRLGQANELRYAWNADPVVEAFDSGLVIPDGVWTLVALVVEPDRATLYAGDAQGLGSAVHVHPHAPEEFDGPTSIGGEGQTSRYFQGWIDDVRVYGYSLSPGAVQGLPLGGAAYAPSPPDGAELPDPTSPLLWNAGTGGGTHDVYLGTDPDAVATATTASPEYMGNVPVSQFSPSGLVDGPTYFWRVDEVVGGQVLAGQPWQFTLAERYRWRLDETGGSIAVESEVGLDGTYVNGPTLGIPGATPSSGTAIALNGLDQEVQLPALQLNSDRVTISGWFRRSGNQVPGAGLVYTRDGNSVAGLNLGFANELRYNWNDDSNAWTWNSGLVVPDGQWIFAAVVVEPTQATLVLGQGGTLSSAVNVLTHTPEEFDGLLRIGRDPSGARFFKGAVDDVRVFDAALTLAQLDALYQASL